MWKPHRGTEGYTLIETAAAVCIFLSAAAGILSIMRANAELMLQDQEISYLYDSLYDSAFREEGSPTGKELEVVFALEGEEEEQDYAAEAFLQYRFCEEWERGAVSWELYRHKAEQLHK